MGPMQTPSGPHWEPFRPQGPHGTPRGPHRGEHGNPSVLYPDRQNALPGALPALPGAFYGASPHGVDPGMRNLRFIMHHRFGYEVLLGWLLWRGVAGMASVVKK